MFDWNSHIKFELENSDILTRPGVASASRHHKSRMQIYLSQIEQVEKRDQYAKNVDFKQYLRLFGRGERIRTSGLYVPNVALYQAKLHPEYVSNPCIEGFLLFDILTKYTLMVDA